MNKNDEISLNIKELDKACRLMTKHNITELTLPDGTKLVRPLHAAFLPKTKPVKPAAPINDPTEGVDIRFAAVAPGQKNDFTRFRASNVLSKRDAS
jgi:hypothetical protein